jgi:hypothetical protein
MKVFNYLKYSGASVIFTLNPFHWRLIPYYGRSQEWGEEHTHVVILVIFNDSFLDR